MTTTIECQMKFCKSIIDKKYCGEKRVKLVRRGYSLYCTKYRLDKKEFIRAIREEMIKNGNV